MPDTLLRPRRCSKCGTLSKGVYILGCRYICDRNKCLAEAICEVGELLGRPSAEIDAALADAMRTMRRGWTKD
jgi:hypothetical protein